VLSLALSPDYANDGVLFAGTESCGLFRGDEGGRAWERLGEDTIQESVNGIVLSAEFPARPDLLVALGAQLLVSRDGGGTWADWKPDLPIATGVASVAAPQGLAPQAPLFVGLVEGGVLRI
jgi:photosystem II stability/assembly factor-like uncharacterized protein